MVGERAEIHVARFSWTDRTIDHLLEHDVRPEDILYMQTNGALAYLTRPGAYRFASHALVGRDSRSRSLIVFVSETAEPGTWRVHTAYQARLAHQLLESEGRL